MYFFAHRLINAVLQITDNVQNDLHELIKKMILKRKVLKIIPQEFGWIAVDEVQRRRNAETGLL